MILPNEFETIVQNPLVIGAFIIEKLKKKPFNLENLFQQLRSAHNITIEQYFDTLTFLWVAEIIVIKDNQINFLKTNDTQKTLYDSE